MVGKALSPEQIANLLANANKPKTPRQRKAKDIRDYDTWFDLVQVIDSQCEIEDHEDRVNQFDFEDQELYDKAMNRKRVVSNVNGKLMCRYCFLTGANPLTQAGDTP
jgi:hypothetical protein